MAVPPPYQLRLNTNDIDAAVEAAKPQILQTLAPHLEGAVEPIWTAPSGTFRRTRSA